MLSSRTNQGGWGRWRVWVIGIALGLMPWVSGRADSVTGADWIIHFNLPDQSSLSVSKGEYDIRNALLARINQLQNGDEAWLATYTFSGNSASAGAAGPILEAMSNALARGASVRFVADYGINIGSNYWPGISLSSLAARPGNALILAQDDSPAGIMHDKLGAFRFQSTNRWVFVGSWNFTGGASINQWNIALELRNERVYSAYTNEFAQFLAGHFHGDPAKAHAHDGARFQWAESWGEGWVRFAPYPDDLAGGNNAQTDITNLIGQAEEEIVFGLNKLTRPLIRDALIAAADRGVMIHGAIPISDRADAGDDSYAVYTYLTNALNYQTTNVVHIVPIFSKADGTAYDTGQTDLLHAKYMVIDPWGRKPVLIHGSANWTDSALASVSANDENLLFLRHAPLAQLFYAQFKRMTGCWTNRSDFSCAMVWQDGLMKVNGWVTDQEGYVVETKPLIEPEWRYGAEYPTGRLGWATLVIQPTSTVHWFRLKRK